MKHMKHMRHRASQIVRRRSYAISSTSPDRKYQEDRGRKGGSLGISNSGLPEPVIFLNSELSQRDL